MFNFLKINSFIFFIILIINPMALASNLDEGINSFQNQNYNEAINFFNKAVKENPDDPEPHKWLSKCYSELFMLELSLKEIEKTKMLQDKKDLLKRKKLNEEKENTILEDNKKLPTIEITIDNNIKIIKYKGKKNIKIAILDFNYKPTYYNENKISKSFTDYLTSNIFSSGISIVEREQINEITKELDFEHSKFVLRPTAKKIGKIYGIDYIVLGSILDFYQNKKTLYDKKGHHTLITEVSLRLSVKLINIENGEVEYTEVLADSYQGSDAVFTGENNFELENRLLKDFSKKITNNITQKLNSKFSK